MITANMITHQCMVLDFCLEASVRCALDLCDDVIISDGKSTDGTLDLLYTLKREFGKDRIKIFERDWSHTRAMWTEERNWILDKISDDAYVLAIDADELIHEDDMGAIKQLTANKVPAVSFAVTHFYGRPTHYIEGPAWYKRHMRLFNKSTGIRWVHQPRGCADDILWPDGFPAHLGRNIKTNFVLYHYGNCRSPKALGMKAKKADDLYQGSVAYKGGSIAKPRSFTYAFDTVGVLKYEGKHPKYIHDWYKLHEHQDTTYDANDEDDGVHNKLWCFEEPA
jgi:hypothetical protein